MTLDYLAHARARVASIILGLVVVSCGGDDSGTVTVTLDFPSPIIENQVSTVHVWVLTQNDVQTEGETPPGCNALVSEELLPYDVPFNLRFDDVLDYPPEGEDGLKLEDVPGGTSLVYVEAVDFGGGALLAGCAEAGIEGSTEVTIQLRSPGTYDCVDPAVANGEPCDDFDLCTLDEECRNGSCGFGVDRDCNALNDMCNSATCDSDAGCVVDPLPDGTPCASGDYCTTGEQCDAGECLGVDRDCSGSVPQCYEPICNENINSCGTIPVSDIPCDDADACTMNDTCSGGFCDSAPLDEDGDGHSPILCGGEDCDDAVPQEDPDIANEIGLCGDTFDNDCDGCQNGADVDCGGIETAGQCTGGVDDDCDGCVDGVEASCGGSEAAACADGLDNDCDGCLNGADSNCGGTEDVGGAVPANCSDGIDNDCDGLTDTAQDTVDCT